MAYEDYEGVSKDNLYEDVDDDWDDYDEDED